MASVARKIDYTRLMYTSSRSYHAASYHNLHRAMILSQQRGEKRSSYLFVLPFEFDEFCCLSRHHRSKRAPRKRQRSWTPKGPNHRGKHTYIQKRFADRQARGGGSKPSPTGRSADGDTACICPWYCRYRCSTCRHQGIHHRHGQPNKHQASVNTHLAINQGVHACYC